MSFEQLRRAWKAPAEGPAERLVLLALADQARDDGLAEVSQMTLAGLTSLSDRHVRRVLTDLIATGLVSVTSGKGGRTLSRYQLHLPQPDTTSGHSVREDTMSMRTSALRRVDIGANLSGHHVLLPSQIPSEPQDARARDPVNGRDAHPEPDPYTEPDPETKAAAKARIAEILRNPAAQPPRRDPETERRKASDLAAALGVPMSGTAKP